MQQQPSWIAWVSLGLKIALVTAAVYLGVVYYQRWTREPLEPDQPKRVKVHDDFYVHPPKSYVTDAATARKLIGDPLWVKVGYSWLCDPCKEPLGPLEKVVPTGVRESGDQVLLEFRRDGKLVTVPIGAHGRMYVDEMFFIEDPRSLYDHWSAEVWEKIEAHQVEPGMSEFQVNFALGAGRLARSSPGGGTRVVDYRARTAAGWEPIRVTFQNHTARSVEKLSASEG